MNQVIGSNITSVPSISSSAMLVELNISVWTGRKLDKQVSAEIDAQKQTTTRAGNYNKKLFADEPAFDAIGKFAGNARTFHYHATMPWSDSGLRLLTTAMYFEYHKMISQMEMDFSGLVDEFLNDYQNMVLRAQHKLGAMFNVHDYPDPDSLRDKFRFSVKFSPVPDVGDWRVDIGNDAQQVLKESYASAYSANLEQAYQDVWTRTHEALANMSNKLAGENKQIFRDTLVTNVKEMIDLLDKFNITGDAKMKQAKVKIENALLGVTPDALREDDYLRLDTKQKVDDLLKEFSW
jgi:uncharacterized lipoprotein NlpE involved in copper resistance